MSVFWMVVIALVVGIILGAIIAKNFTVPEIVKTYEDKIIELNGTLQTVKAELAQTVAQHASMKDKLTQMIQEHIEKISEYEQKIAASTTKVKSVRATQTIRGKKA
jgi:uncharacterized membrane-anchored protein YhcB (DUF1043 family)